MKTIKIEMSDTIYGRLEVAGTKAYNPEMPNPDYDPKIEGSLAKIPNTIQTRDQYLARVVDKAVKQILKNYEVNEVANEAVKTKQDEIDKLNITSTII